MMNDTTVPFFSIVDYVFLTIFRIFKNDPNKARRFTMDVIRAFQHASMCFTPIPENKLQICQILPNLSNLERFSKNIQQIAIKNDENDEKYFLPEEIFGLLAATLNNKNLCDDLNTSIPYLIYLTYRICANVNIDQSEFRNLVAVRIIGIANHHDPDFCSDRMCQVADECFENINLKN